MRPEIYGRSAAASYYIDPHITDRVQAGAPPVPRPPNPAAAAPVNTSAHARSAKVGSRLHRPPNPGYCARAAIGAGRVCGRALRRNGGGGGRVRSTSVLFNATTPGERRGRQEAEF